MGIQLIERHIVDCVNYRRWRWVDPPPVAGYSGSVSVRAPQGDTSTEALLREVARRHVRSQRDHLTCSGVASVVECHVLTELAAAGQLTSAQLASRLDMDKGQLSRALTKMAAQRLIVRKPVPGDARATALSLSAAGRRTHAALDATLNAHASGLLSRLSPAERGRVHAALQALSQAYGASARMKR